MSVENFTSEDWKLYNEGCQKLIAAIKARRTKIMADISYPTDANGAPLDYFDESLVPIISEGFERWCFRPALFPSLLTSCRRDL